VRFRYSYTELLWLNYLRNAPPVHGKNIYFEKLAIRSNHYMVKTAKPCWQQDFVVLFVFVD